MRERKNGTITAKSITPRTSPKLFKTNQTSAAPDNDIKIQIKYEIEVQKNHSIASQSVSPKELLQMSYHATGRRCENDISGITASTTITGIKQETLEEFTGTSRDVEIKMRRKWERNQQRSIARMCTTTSNNVIVEPISHIHRHATQIQLEWINRVFLENLQPITRDERLKLKKSYLRHVLDRHEGLHQTRKERREISKRQFVKTCKLLKAMNREREEM